MLSFSRAGLLALILVYLLSYAPLVAFSAPINDTPAPSLANRVSTNTIRLPKRSGNPPDIYRTAKFPRHALASVEPNTQVLVHRGFWGKIKKGFKSVGNAVKKGVGYVAKNTVGRVVNKVVGTVKHVTNKVKNVVNTVKNGVKSVANRVKNVATKVVNGVKSAAKYVKKHGKQIAKIAKLGLKVMTTATSVGSKVAKFIPGVGIPISAALSTANKVGNVASKAINVGDSSLDKSLGFLDKIENPGKAVGGVMGTVLDNLKREGDVRVFRREVF